VVEVAGANGFVGVCVKLGSFNPSCAEGALEVSGGNSVPLFFPSLLEVVPVSIGDGPSSYRARRAGGSADASPGVCGFRK